MTISKKRADDARALAAILECLNYVERELGALDMPTPDTVDLVRQAAKSAERALARSEERTLNAVSTRRYDC
jgi:hypothetical protein